MALKPHCESYLMACGAQQGDVDGVWSDGLFLALPQLVVNRLIADRHLFGLEPAAGIWANALSACLGQPVAIPKLGLELGAAQAFDGGLAPLVAATRLVAARVGEVAVVWVLRAAALQHVASSQQFKGAGRAAMVKRVMA